MREMHLVLHSSKRGIVIKEVRNCIYTVVNNGFGNYRVIGREVID